MQYIKKTFEYLFVLEKGKRFLTLFLLALPVGFVAAFAAPNAVVFKWLSDFTVGDSDFWHAWCFNGNLNWQVTVGGLCVAVIFIMFFFSVMSTVVARSMRVGVFKLSGMFREFNESFFPVMAATLMYMAITLIIKALLTTLFVMFQTFEDVAVAALFSSIAGLLAFLLLCFMVTIGVLYLPFMVFNGLRSFHAFTASAGKITGKLQLRMFGAVTLPVAICVGTGVAVGAAGNAIASIIVETVTYSLTFTYIVALTFVSYYEILGIKREDYPREYFYYKPKRRS